MKKYAELVGLNTKFEKNFNPNLNSSILSMSTSAKSGPEGILGYQNTETDMLRKRDGEINNLVESINDLTNIFKDLQSLVFEQGNINVYKVFNNL